MANPESRSHLTPGYSSRRQSNQHNLHPGIDWSESIRRNMIEATRRAIANKANSEFANDIPKTNAIVDSSAAPDKPRLWLVPAPEEDTASPEQTPDKE